ncbi:phosphate ABC transporter permease PstA [Nitrincola iocasae]|uniref:Phosphate transport system permease protein PstA n=2 Tax=Nitrincola iocasae TaxID=2614693 RepID=A0A5J6LHU4_9GAMM|nr:phosphate ABC transporter permease PstA [Nitrincola iocasae]
MRLGSFRQDLLWLWFCGSMLLLSLMLVAALLLLIGTQGLSHFWPEAGEPQRLVRFLQNIWLFLSEPPRENNQAGGIFPALFGTITMVFLMTLLVTPIGVLAAIYLSEYARQNLMTRVLRIAIYNLAGVPSIVFGVFGLVFFVYILGGSVDKLFYSEQLPTPTYGTPGLIWVSLTLALLTLPVVIVATEEGLSRIPKDYRSGCLALGATQTEMLWRVVLPMTTPAILTGIILAIARAAGEVAPLMLVGVVRTASQLPIDTTFPYLHLDRNVMHLGYHIFDVGMQSPAGSDVMPLVFAAALILVTLVITLNLTAIIIRQRLRQRFRQFTRHH